MEALNQSFVELGVASRPMRGEFRSGDAHVARAFHGGLLAAVADGLGHGDDAAHAAETCVKTLESHPNESVDRLVKRCHADLVGTRGVTLSLASFDTVRHQLSWIGVGNVEGLLWRIGRNGVPVLQPLLLRSGVVGMRLPPLFSTRLPVSRGDTLVLATDGIAEGFAGAVRAVDPPQSIADRLMAAFGKQSDDALVLVARYLGPPA